MIPVGIILAALILFIYGHQHLHIQDALYIFNWSSINSLVQKGKLPVISTSFVLLQALRPDIPYVCSST